MNSSFQEPEHFEALLSNNSGRLQRIARSYAPENEVKDLLQDMYLQLWRSRNTFSGNSHINTWLYRVALNTAISFARRRQGVTVSVEETDEGTVAGNTGDSLHLLDDFLKSLNDVNRCVLLMYVEGLTHKEIAAVLGSRANSVAVRLNRIKRDFEDRYIEDKS